MSEEVAAPTVQEPEPIPEIRHRTFKHWVRPKTQQYHYINDYMRNYYDDVLDYLDKRQKGLRVPPPRPQYWAERALRTYLNKSSSYKQAEIEDTILRSHIRTDNRFYQAHYKGYNERRYTFNL
ncbi:flightin-like [Ctenocephalides felis]|uniref:flightin-like n=1 Tax=Ctenocephalides felis TaxID=7515 RepID=UPI000E6E2FE1|nr:flightin-like [Ctenocephalides felis]